MRKRTMRLQTHKMCQRKARDNCALRSGTTVHQGPGQLCIKARDLQDQYLAGDSEINKERACPMLILNLGFFWTCQSCTVFAYVKPPSLGPHDNASFRRFCRACLQFNWLLQQSWNHFGKSAFVRLNRSNVNSVVVTRDFLGYCWKSSDLISEAPYWPFDKRQWANCMSPSTLYLG